MERVRENVWLFSISGIVGSGKSTAMKRLKKSGFLREEVEALWNKLGASAVVGSKVNSFIDLPQIVFVQEPVKLWRERNWLQRYYADSDLYAAAFQLLVFCTHVDAVEACIKDHPGPLIIMAERSMYDQLLFWYQQKELGKVTADAMYDEAYMAMWKLRHCFIPGPSGIFFFYTEDIQHTMQRVQRRARAEELGCSSSSSSSGSSSLNSSRVGLDGGAADEIKEVNGLTVEYQEALLARHRAWFTEPIAFPPHTPGDKGIPCMHVIADEPYHENDGTLRDLARRMALFIVKNI